MDLRAWREGIRREGVFAPLRPEPVALTSARTPDEVLARVEAATVPVRTSVGWYYGGDAVVRKGDARRLRLAVRRRLMYWGRPGGDGMRPVADVQVEPRAEGAFVGGTLGLPRGVAFLVPLFAALGALIAVGMTAAAVVTRDAGPLVGAAFGAFFCGNALRMPWRSYDDRATLRTVLQEAVS